MEVIVLQHTTSEEMGIKTPLINHQYYIDEEEVMEEALVGRGAQRPNIQADHENKPSLSRHVYDNSDMSEVKESLNEDGSENGEKSSTNVYFDNKEGASMDVEKKIQDKHLGFRLDEGIKNALSAVINGETEADSKGKTLSGLRLTPSTNPLQEDGTNSRGQTENLQVDIVDEIEEEVIELEFERAVEKMHTHHGYEMYCPNCSNRITKVVLRRRIVKRVPAASSDKPLDLLGCLSCFSIFVAAGNKLNPFRLFGRGRETESSSLPQQQQRSDAHSSTSSTHSSTVQHQQTSSITSSTQINDTTSTITRSTQVEDITSSVTSSTQIKAGKGFDLFSVFWKGRVEGNDRNVQPSSVPTIDKTTKQEQSVDASKESSGNSNEAFGSYNIIDTGRLHGKALLLGSTATKVAAAVAIAGNSFQTSSFQGSKFDEDVIIDINKDLDGVIKGVKHPATLGSEIKEEVDIIANQQEGRDVQVLIEEGPVRTETSQFTESITVIKVPGILTEAPSSKSLEIVKAIVYGGLMESIASLSVVSSGAASGVTTLKILALGLANLVSGLIVLGHNFSDLKYGEFSQSDEAVKRYKELLGRKEHFLLHAVVGLLSYLVFGIVPLVTYGFTFRESDNRDYKILAVAGASLLSIIILAIMKAYTRGQHKFSAYFKAVVYYITCAVMVSGVAYAVGDLASKLMERSGWWDSSPVKALLITDTKSINPTFVSY